MIIHGIQSVLRSFGFQVVRSPIPNYARTRDVLQRVFKCHSINCVLDVGANTGQYGTLLRAIGYKGWIISFEPVRSTYEVLARTASKDARWRVFQYALGATSGQFEINLMADSSCTSFLDPAPEAWGVLPQICIQGKETVEVHRLEEILGECIKGIPAPRVYLKLDTQGVDVEVLKGAIEILPQVLSLQSEVAFRPTYRGMKSYAESIAEFNKWGFYVVDFIPVVRDMDRLCMIEMDCVMARRPEWPASTTGA